MYFPKEKVKKKTNLPLDFSSSVCYNISRGENMEIKWIYLGTIQADSAAIWCDEYISEDGTMGKQVWNDGYEEEYEV